MITLGISFQQTSYMAHTWIPCCATPRHNMGTELLCAPEPAPEHLFPPCCHFAARTTLVPRIRLSVSPQWLPSCTIRCRVGGQSDRSTKEGTDESTVPLTHRCEVPRFATSYNLRVIRRIASLGSRRLHQDAKI